MGLPQGGRTGTLLASVMRALVQRVLEASVTVEGKKVSEIGPGLLVLLGVGKEDEDRQADWLAEKVATLRIFEDSAEKMNLSLLDTTRRLIAVSQFTLYADTRKGRRPSFVLAKEPAEAERLYRRFCSKLRELGVDVKEGVFGADMKVALVNDGPVTLMVETPA